ncbi:MAG: glycoside hydrolase family 3 N-terminal domain-containing protein [Bacillota bacterium]|nr:glycoside hydrolase family 3 N-terminal domain-containing protein [Bacillota bacterium]
MKKDLHDIINAMTPEEKIGQLNLVSFNENTEDEVRRGRAGAVLNANRREDIERLQRAARESRLGIPLLVGADVIHGFYTTFPVPLAEASSFNLGLIEKAAEYAAREAAAEGINWIYAPILDLPNDPRWGRIMESAGEDPLLIGLTAAARVRGIQRNNVAACLKHYIGYGKVEAGIDYQVTDFSEHRLRTYYLPPYRMAIEAGAMSVMSAFTTYDALPITASPYIMNDILRRELGFDGVVVSDWDCLKHLFNYKVAGEGWEAAETGVRRAIDIDMHSRVYDKYLLEAMRRDAGLARLVDEAVLRVLKLKEKIGLFAGKRNPAQAPMDIGELAEEIAAEAIILLKNDKRVLPLDRRARLLVVGPFNDDGDIHLGAWSALGRPERTVTTKAGIKALFPKSEFFAVPKNAAETDFKALKMKAAESDALLLCLGESRSLSGENNNRASLDLPGGQDALADFLARENIPFIAYVTAGRPLAIANLCEKAGALLWSFHLGHKAGVALAKVLAGVANPSAKTTVTFPRSLGQVPIYYNRLPCGRPDIARYMDEELEPLFPFGYGLSYSEFRYRRPKASYEAARQTITVSGRIENTSALAGKEVIQVYLTPLKTSVLLPEKSLIGFEKILVPPKATVNYKINCPIERGLYHDEIALLVGTSSRTGEILRVKLE